MAKLGFLAAPDGRHAGVEVENPPLHRFDESVEPGLQGTPPAVLVEMTATAAYTGLETMTKDVAVPDAVPLARAAARANTEPAAATRPPPVPAAPSSVPALPPAPTLESPTPAVQPTLAPAAADASDSAAASPSLAVRAPVASPSPGVWPVRLAAESSLAVAPYHPAWAWGAGLAAAVVLPTVPLAPRLALGVLRAQEVEGGFSLPGQGGNSHAAFVATAEAAGAPIRSPVWSWHIGPRLTWTRFTREPAPNGPPPGEMRGAPGPEPSGARTPVSRGVFELGFATRVARALGPRAEIFAAAGATFPLASVTADPGRGPPERGAWTVTTSLGLAFALTSPL